MSPADGGIIVGVKLKLPGFACRIGVAIKLGCAVH
jgi:hypothetical protein